SGCLSLLDQRAECYRIVDRQICERLSVDLDSRDRQAVDKAAVGHIVHPTGGVDTGDPQSAEIALASPTVSEGILPCMHHRLIGHLKPFAAVAPVATRGLEDLIVTLAGHHPALH